MQIFIPTLDASERLRQEQQQRLEQSNAWLQRRLQAIDPFAGRAYSPQRAARSPGSAPSAQHEGSASLQDSRIPAVYDTRPSTSGNPFNQGSSPAVQAGGRPSQQGAFPTGFQLNWGSPVPPIDLAGIKNFQGSPTETEM